MKYKSYLALYPTNNIETKTKELKTEKIKCTVYKQRTREMYSLEPFQSALTFKPNNMPKRLKPSLLHSPPV